MNISKLFFLLLLPLFITSSIHAMESQQKYLYVQLYFAVTWQDKDMVKQLLEKNADPNFTDTNNNRSLYYDKLKRAPLHNAVALNNKDIVQLLLNAKADINIQNYYHYEWTPLNYAAWNGFTEMITLLIENKADIDSPSKFPPLGVAIHNHKAESVSIILKHKKELKLRPYEYITSLYKYLPLIEKHLMTIVCSFKKISQKLNFKFPKPIILMIIDYWILSEEELIEMIQKGTVQQITIPDTDRNLTLLEYAQKHDKNIAEIIQHYLPPQEKTKNTDCTIF